ncbi:Ser-Thr-rich GPI-anchored membrane family protein [Aureispira anguillae]|uniref:T9SS type A sorting domain-containing protein n=1 Tax=Aureispira anguillae TaxID=2864201 RepID=A0A915YE28_9BACT|nr:Ser-Thr-rich GPI-anchored membrane family protein [Aureispira anguillae]BDS11408.1 T9SS type A sorting domain-containing protein [Aureispira anguillae]
MKNILKITRIKYIFILFFIGCIANNANAWESPTINIIDPTANTVWNTGQNVTIRWTSNFPASANLKIFLYEGNRRVAKVASFIPNTGSYTYSVPNSLINSSLYRLQIFDVANPAASVTFSDFFTINSGSPTINIIDPTASTVWNTGQNVTIRWSSNFSASANLRIFLYEGNNQVATVANFIPNTGSYTYSVPNSLINSSLYRLQIFDIANPAASVAYSDFFTINSGSPTINIINPTANTVWYTGQNVTIRWTSNFSASANLKIFLYEGNRRVATVANFIPNTGSYTYSVPNSLANSSLYRLQIFDVANPAASVTFSDFFTISNSYGSRSSLPTHENVENSGQQNGIEHLYISPTPQLAGTISKVIIQSSENITAQMVISDMTGRIVDQKTIELTKGDNQIDTTPITEKGMYVLSIQTANTNKSLKLIVVE